MLKLYAGFRDGSRGVLVCEGAASENIFGLFDTAKTTHHIQDREIVDLWIVDERIEDNYVLKIWERVRVNRNSHS